MREVCRGLVSNGCILDVTLALQTKALARLSKMPEIIVEYDIPASNPIAVSL